MTSTCMTWHVYTPVHAPYIQTKIIVGVSFKTPVLSTVVCKVNTCIKALLYNVLYTGA